MHTLTTPHTHTHTHTHTHIHIHKHMYIRNKHFNRALHNVYIWPSRVFIPSQKRKSFDWSKSTIDWLIFGSHFSPCLFILTVLARISHNLHSCRCYYCEPRYEKMTSSLQTKHFKFVLFWIRGCTCVLYLKLFSLFHVTTTVSHPHGKNLFPKKGYHWRKQTSFKFWVYTTKVQVNTVAGICWLDLSNECYIIVFKKVNSNEVL